MYPGIRTGRGRKKRLQSLEKVKSNYALSKRENKESREKAAALEADNQVLTDDLQYRNNFTKVVMEQLNCGIIVYTIPGRNLLEINKEAMRIFGWKNREDAAENFAKKWDSIHLSDNAAEM